MLQLVQVVTAKISEVAKTDAIPRKEDKVLGLEVGPCPPQVVVKSSIPTGVVQLHTLRQDGTGDGYGPCAGRDQRGREFSLGEDSEEKRSSQDHRHAKNTARGSLGGSPSSPTTWTGELPTGMNSADTQPRGC